MELTCKCARINVGMRVTESRNWNPDCPEHGVESEWYGSPEQREIRSIRDARLRSMQRAASEARKAAAEARKNADRSPSGPRDGKLTN